jgi:hypothetical protein
VNLEPTPRTPERKRSRQSVSRFHRLPRRSTEIVSRRGIRRGAFTSVRALVDATQSFLDHWNDDRKPFVWVKTAFEILATLHRQRSHETVH